jgi:integrase
MKSEWVKVETVDIVLNLLTPPNRLVIELSMATGLRVGDCLGIRSAQLRGASQRRITVREEKTGKTRRIYIPRGIYERMLQQAGQIYVFENRLDPKKHRCRQAVWKDLRRARRALRVPENVTPHSARKMYAVELYEKTGDLALVADRLKHSSTTVTMVYAFANHLERSRKN